MTAFLKLKARSDCGRWEKAKQIPDEPGFHINNEIRFPMFDACTVDGAEGEYISSLNIRWRSTAIQPSAAEKKKILKQSA